jgi:hypothetical protein
MVLGRLARKAGESRMLGTSVKQEDLLRGIGALVWEADPGDLRFVVEAGCERGQGFLFSRAVPGDVVAAL